jgi:hypothetical protein
VACWVPVIDGPVSGADETLKSNAALLLSCRGLIRSLESGMGFVKWDNQAELEKVLVETRGEEPNPDLLS